MIDQCRLIVLRIDVLQHKKSACPALIIETCDAEGSQNCASSLLNYLFVFLLSIYPRIHMHRQHSHSSLVSGKCMYDNRARV